MKFTRTYSVNEKDCLEWVLRGIVDLYADNDYLNDSVEAYLNNEDNNVDIGDSDDIYAEAIEKLGDYCFDVIEEIIEKAIDEYCSYRG